jgi:hypothetical protein
MATPAPSKTPASTPTPAPRPAAAAPIKSSRLGLVERKKLGFPPRVMIYGPEGVGKTTIAVDADALFLDIEGGSGETIARRYPFHPGERDEFKPRSYEEVCDAVEDLIANPSHEFKAIAIDTGDALEALVHRSLCEKNKVSSIEKVGGGYGKGYRASTEELRRFLARLDLLRATNVTIIFLAHSMTSTFKNPEGEDYDRFSLKVHKDFAAELKQWSEIVGFIHFEGGARKLEDDGAKERRARGWTTNRRLMQLARDAAWDAKWRLTVPMPMEFEVDSVHPWAPFADAIERARRTGVTSINDQIIAELDRIGADAFTTKAGRTTTRADVLELIATADNATITSVLAGLVVTPKKEN